MSLRRMLVLLLVIAAAGGQIAAGQEVFGPRIAVKGIRYDAGTVKQGIEVSHVFEVRNEGTDTLIIKQVQPG